MPLKTSSIFPDVLFHDSTHWQEPVAAASLSKDSLHCTGFKCNFYECKCTSYVKMVSTVCVM